MNGKEAGGRWFGGVLVEYHLPLSPWYALTNSGADHPDTDSLETDDISWLMLVLGEYGKKT